MPFRQPTSQVRLRKVFLQQQSIKQWSNDYIRTAVDKLNLRSRKCLDWKTAYEIYFKKSFHLV